MSTNILAASVYKHDDEIQPNFKGWSKGAINLYYALMSYASLDKHPENGYLKEEWYYINKKPLGEKAPGRKWMGWKGIEEAFGIDHMTLYRAKQSLKSGVPPYSWAGLPIIREDSKFIYIYNANLYSKYNKYIDHSVMKVLSAYVASQGGDTTIMRLYSAFKIAKEDNLKLSLSQLLYFCGLYDIQYKNKENTNRAKVRNCLAFLKAFHILELEDETQLRGKINTLVFWASSFPPSLSATTNRVLAFLSDGALSEAERQEVEGLLAKFGE